MKWMLSIGFASLAAGLVCGLAQAQDPAAPPSPNATQSAYNSTAADDPVVLSPVPLEWTPPALERLSALAPVKESFTLDRNLLSLAAGLVPDSESEDRQVIRKLDGVSVHLMRFGDTGIPDEREVTSIRAAYHLRGWKHLVSTTGSGSPLHNGTTDVWIVMDGVNVRGAVILAETPRTLTLVTLAGNLNPVDLLHLRGHFGIPRFDGDGLHDPHGQ
ncbi:MAG TPA: DUF4252 domain-containing protein [Terracidiphilus sp.]|jgi:hypothetical protein|nr:DUF4252 domain-containing protein [Terracidiphilus sp.]